MLILLHFVCRKLPTLAAKSYQGRKRTDPFVLQTIRKHRRKIPSLMQQYSKNENRL
jgi:hypothetical protein